MAEQHVRTYRNFTPTTHHDTYPFMDTIKADLSGRSVLITGASGGIGKAISISYAKAGATTIVIAARSSLSQLTSDVRAAATAAGHPEPKVVELKMDVTSVDSVSECADQVRAQIGHTIDIVIANHGVLEPWTRITESDPLTYWKTYEVNNLGTYLVAKSFLPFVQRKPSLGIFVILSSIGQHVIADGASSYQSGTLALHRLSEFINVEGDAAVKEGKVEQAPCCFVIHPGGVLTDMGLGMPAAFHAALIDRPEMCGDSLVWLTKERRDWLRSRYISCNWDMQELEDLREEIEQKDLLKMRLTLY